MNPIRLTGAPNFRDLGGYTATDGRAVRYRRLFRSGALDSLSDADLVQVSALGIATVGDIRSQVERESHPTRWPEGSSAEFLHLDVDADLRAGNRELMAILSREPSRESAWKMMLGSYRMMPRALARHLPELTDRLIEGNGPVVFHCTAGKDRTGVLSALLLHALGVPLDTIYHDYLLTAEYADFGHLRQATAGAMAHHLGSDIDPVVIDTLTGVRREFLDAALDEVATEHGSIDRYLERAGGLDAARRRRLQDSLLVL